MLTKFDKYILSFVYEEPVVVWGPYPCKDGRHRVDVKRESVKKSTTHQLAKVKLELKMGRRLREGETVDHIDGDFRNDGTPNLRAMTLSENSADSVRRLESQEFSCPECSSTFYLSGRKLKDAAANREAGKSGPFCGRSCAGRYGAEVQNGRRENLEVVTIERRYFTRKSMR